MVVIQKFRAIFLPAALRNTSYFCSLMLFGSIYGISVWLPPSLGLHGTVNFRNIFPLYRRNFLFEFENFMDYLIALIILKLKRRKRPEIAFSMKDSSCILPG